MRCILGFCVAALPIAAPFAVRPAVGPLSVPCQKSKDSIMFPSRAKRHRTRRYAGEGGPVNLDSSDDEPEADDEMYASLRKRLEELEKNAPIAAAAAEEVEAPPRVQAAREREFTIPKESAEDKKRSRALLTIQSVGVISAALSFGTLALYWLAGAYFVHLGPREYPGSASSRGGANPTTSSSIERTATPGAEDEGAATSAQQARPRRAMGGSSSREAFRFEGFPDVVGKDVVAPDF